MGCPVSKNNSVSQIEKASSNNKYTHTDVIALPTLHGPELLNQTDKHKSTCSLDTIYMEIDWMATNALREITQDRDEWKTKIQFKVRLIMRKWSNQMAVLVFI